MSMAGSYVGFDPYQQWLGIPPHEQPPHQYRLLGVPLFEPDLQAIALAADRLLGYLGTVSDPAYAPIASRLYEEIVTARTALTDPYRKAQYDGWLQQTLYAAGGMQPGYGTGYASTPSNHGAPTPGYGAPQGYVSHPSQHGQQGYVSQPSNHSAPAGYAPQPSYVSQPSNHGAPDGYVNGVQGYAAQQPTAQDYGVPAAPMSPVNNSAGYSTGSYYTQPAPQPAPTYTEPAPQYAPQGYGSTPGYGVNQSIPMVPQAPVQAPVQMHATSAPEMATAGWQVGARPLVSSEPEVVGSGPAPMKMFAIGGAVLVGIIIIGVLRNMDDKKPARTVASNIPATETPIKRTSGDKLRPPVSPTEAPAPSTDIPEVVEPTEPEPLPVKPEPKTLEPKKKPEPKMDPEDDPEPVPTKPETKKPEPKPETNPETTKPEPPAVDPQALKKGGELLGKVRLALARRDIKLAKERLKAAKELHLEPLSQDIARLEMLASNLDDFWGAVRKSIESLKNVDEIEIGNSRVAVVEATSEKLILRIGGVNKTYPLDSMSPKLTLFLANRWYKPVPSSKIFIGSFHAIDAQGDRKEAKSLWEAAKREGGSGEKDVVDLLMPELSIPMPENNPANMEL